MRRATLESNWARSGKFENANSSFILSSVPREMLMYMAQGGKYAVECRSRLVPVLPTLTMFDSPQLCIH